MIFTQSFLSDEATRRNIYLESHDRIMNYNDIIFAEKKGYDLFISHSYLDKK